MVYSDLIMSKPGILGQPTYSDYLPDAAQSWETSPDGLTITFNATASAASSDRIDATYNGDDTCEGPISGGRLAMSRQMR